MNKDIPQLILEKGPCLTSDIIDVLKDSGVEKAAARKRIQRAIKCGKITRLAGITFEKNARFIYRAGQFGKDDYWKNFEYACKRAGRSYWATIQVLKARGGIVPLALFPRITGAAEKRKRQLSSNKILEALENIHLLHTYLQDNCRYVGFKPAYYLSKSDDLELIRARISTEKIVLVVIREWARRIGIGSYDKFTLRFDDEKSPLVSGIEWDLTAPSYMYHLSSVSNGKAMPGFVVCDINLREEIELDEAEAFIRKCKLASSSKNARPILPIIVAHKFEEKAFKFLKSKGILAITLKNIFDKEIASALNNLTQMYMDLANKVFFNLDKLNEILRSIKKIEGSSNNMRGDLFELVIGGIVQSAENVGVQINKIVYDGEKQAQIDVYVKRERESILVIECKSKRIQSFVSEEEIQKWYSKLVPRIHKALQNDEDNSEVSFRFELWTNGSFVMSGLKWLESQKKVLDGYTIGWKEKKELKAYAAKAGNKHYKDMLYEHYFHS